MKKQLAHFLSVEVRRFIRFIIVGIVNATASFGFYAFYLYAGILNIISGTMSFVTSIFFNYFVMRRFVFDIPTHKYTLIYYFVSYGLLYFYSIALLWFFVDIKITPYMAGLVSLAINAVFSLILISFFVFRRRNLTYEREY